MITFQILPLPVPCGWGRGWGTYNMTCYECHHKWVAVCAVGTLGAECPACGVFDDEANWQSMPNEIPNDGCWITGRLDGDF